MQKEPLKVNSGYFELPSKPGLGVELDEAVILSRPYKSLSYKGTFYDDGGVADV